MAYSIGYQDIRQSLPVDCQLKKESSIRTNFVGSNDQNEYENEVYRVKVCWHAMLHYALLFWNKSIMSIFEAYINSIVVHYIII